MPPPLPPADIGVPLGGGKTVLSAWLDYTCPFSAKFYRRVVEDVVPHYGDKLCFRWYHQIQTWHPQSALLHNAAIVARELGGDGKFWEFSTALFNKQGDFSNEACLHKTTSQLYKDLSAIGASVGLDAEAMYTLLVEGSWVQVQKWHVKLGRTLGVHVSPTTFVNGMPCDTSSSWELAQWKELLDTVVG